LSPTSLQSRATSSCAPLFRCTVSLPICPLHFTAISARRGHCLNRKLACLSSRVASCGCLQLRSSSAPVQPRSIAPYGVAHAWIPDDDSHDKYVHTLPALYSVPAFGVSSSCILCRCCASVVFVMCPPLPALCSLGYEGQDGDRRYQNGENGVFRTSGTVCAIASCGIALSTCPTFVPLSIRACVCVLWFLLSSSSSSLLLLLPLLLLLGFG
jgi:hypothetical protein